MAKRKRAPTKAEQARALHAAQPELAPSAIAKQIGTHVESVKDALRARGKRGRPQADYVTLRVRVPRDLLPWIDERLEDGVYSGRADVVLACVEAEIACGAEHAARTTPGQTASKRRSPRSG
jgi:hypothetical protein